MGNGRYDNLEKLSSRQVQAQVRVSGVVNGMLLIVAVRLNKENIPSRAYIAFKTAEMVMQFAKAFDGHVFKDKSGMSITLVLYTC